MISFVNKYIKIKAIFLCGVAIGSASSPKVGDDIHLCGIPINEFSTFTLFPEAQEMLKRVADPRIDMRLAIYPEHPCPPVYNITFPNGQNMLILGTTHTVPLGCMLPYRIAQDIISASDFVIEEICGQLLPGVSSEITEANNDVEEDENLTSYMTEKRMQKIRQSLVIAYKHIYTNEEGTEKFQNALEIFETAVDQDMSKIFDSNNCWYAKAGIIVGDDSVEADFGSTKYWPTSYPKKLNIKGKIAIVPSRNGKELHPIALGFLHDDLTGSSSYTKPTCGGMDDHLQYMTSIYRKALYAFEEDANRYNESSGIKLIEKIDKSCEAGFWAFKSAIEGLQTHPDEAQKKSKSVTFESAFTYSDFYSAELSKDNSLDVLSRNDIWIQRIMALNQTTFKHAFAYVGRGHLYDLFEKLTKLGFAVSERLSLSTLEDMYS